LQTTRHACIAVSHVTPSIVACEARAARRLLRAPCCAAIPGLVLAAEIMDAVFEPHDGASHEIASCAQLAAARFGRRTGCVPAGIVISFGVDGIVTFMPLRGGQRETAQVLHIVHEGFFVLHCARLC